MEGEAMIEKYKNLFGNISITLWKDWFYLCGKLVNPVKELEDNISKLEETTVKYNENESERGFISNFIVNIIVGYLISSIFLGIIVAIVGIFIKVDGTRLTLFISKPIENYIESLFFANWDGVLFIVSIIISLLMLWVLFLGKIGLYFLPITIICSLCTAMIHQKKVQKLSMELSDQISLLNKSIAELRELLLEPISFIPQNYRNSLCIEYFYDCYVNGRATNQQEAVIACDTPLYNFLKIK